MTPGRFRMARAFGIYNDQTFKKAIHSYKYDEKIQLARPFEKLLFSVFIRHWNKNDIDLVMPVPLHIKRFRERGFNQAYHLIRHWPRIAEKLDIDLSVMRIERNVLFKTKKQNPKPH